MPSQLLRKSFRSALTGTTRQYWLYLPPGYETGADGAGDDRRWPVMLFLHGGGERGEDPEKVLKHGPIKEVPTGGTYPF